MIVPGFLRQAVHSERCCWHDIMSAMHPALVLVAMLHLLLAYMPAANARSGLVWF